MRIESFSKRGILFLSETYLTLSYPKKLLTSLTLSCISTINQNDVRVRPKSLFLLYFKMGNGLKDYLCLLIAISSATLLFFILGPETPHFTFATSDNNITDFTTVNQMTILII